MDREKDSFCSHFMSCDVATAHASKSTVWNSVSSLSSGQLKDVWTLVENTDLQEQRMQDKLQIKTLTQINKKIGSSSLDIDLKETSPGSDHVWSERCCCCVLWELFPKVNVACCCSLALTWSLFSFNKGDCFLWSKVTFAVAEA